MNTQKIRKESLLMIDTEVFVAAEQEIIKVPLRTIALGTDQAGVYITHLIKNEKVEGRKSNFGPGLLQTLHKKVLFYLPRIAGELRLDDDTRVGGRRVARVADLRDLVYLFERWLEQNIEILKNDQENLKGALKLAAAAHYGIVDMHPFDEGNGRLARVLMNGILMLNAKEVAYGIYIRPVPLVRERIDTRLLQEALETGREPKLTPYLQAIETVNKTQTLNPLEVYIASKWVQSIDRFMADYKIRIPQKRDKQKSNKSEQAIVDKIIQRRERLKRFIAEDLAGRRSKDKVPDYKPSYFQR